MSTLPPDPDTTLRPWHQMGTGGRFLTPILTGRGLRVSTEERTNLRALLLEAFADDPGYLSPFADSPEREAHLKERIGQWVREGRLGRTPEEGEARAWVHLLYAETVGLGPLQPLLSDPDITSITVPNPLVIIYEKGGMLHRASVAFRDEAHLAQVVESLVVRSGRNLSDADPVVDFRLRDPEGRPTRIHINRLRDGEFPILTLRRGRKQPYTLPELVAGGSLGAEVAAFLTRVMALPLSFLVIGEANTGKTTLLEAMTATLLAESEKLVVLAEDTPEINVPHPYLMALRPPSGRADSGAPVTLGTLTWAALRLNSSVLVVGEIRRGAETGHLLAAAASMGCRAATVHGDTIESGLERFLGLALAPESPYAGFDLALLMRLIARAFPLVLHTDILPSGKRGVREVAWVAYDEGMRRFAPTWIFRLRAESTGATLWEANPEFHLPPAIAQRLQGVGDDAPPMPTLPQRAQAWQRLLQAGQGEQVCQEVLATWPSAVAGDQPLLASLLERALRQTGRWVEVQRLRGEYERTVGSALQRCAWEEADGHLVALRGEGDGSLAICLRDEVAMYEQHIQRGLAATQEAARHLATARAARQRGQPGWESALAALPRDLLPPPLLAEVAALLAEAAQPAASGTPENPGERYLKAVRLYEAGEYGQALPLFETLGEFRQAANFALECRQQLNGHAALAAPA